MDTGKHCVFAFCNLVLLLAMQTFSFNILIIGGAFHKKCFIVFFWGGGLKLYFSIEKKQQQKTEAFF